MLKKIICSIIAFALILTSIPFGLITNAGNAPQKTVYVSSSGSDTTGNGAENAPYATISKAISDIENDAEFGSGRVVLLDNTAFSTTDHSKKITVCGKEKTVVLNSGTGDESLKGEMTFENITFGANIIFVTRGFGLEFGENTKNTKAITTYLGGAAITSQGENYISVPFDTIDNWQYRTIHIGSDANYIANGDINILVTGGYYHAIRLSTGKYNKNVNIVLDDVKRCASDSKVSIDREPDVNGAIQVVLNGGLDRKTHLLQSESGNFKPFKDYPADDGVWLMYVGANSFGGRLSTTETAGKFAVEGEGVAKAYKITTDSEGNELSRTTEPSAVSNKGVLNLSGEANAGEYVVIFEDYEALPNTDTTVYVSADGSDANDGKTMATAFKTIDFAEKWLNKSTAAGEKIIVVNGKVSFDGGESHSEIITIKGYDNTSELEFETTVYPEVDNVVVLQGPTKFDGIKIPNVVNKRIVTNGNRAEFINMPSEAWENSQILIGNIENITNSVKQENVFIDGSKDSGYLNRTIILGSFGDTPNRNTNGVNFEQKGGRITSFAFWTGKFTDNVNITLSGVKPRIDAVNNGDGIGMNYNANTTKFEGALQLVLNDGQSEYVKNLSNWEDIEAQGGTWIMCGETNDTGTVLEATSVEGEFKVKGKYIAKAYLVTDGVASTTPIVSENGKLTVPEGRYVVKFTPRDPVVNSDAVVYVSQNGDNDNDGKTKDTAFKSFDFALAWLNKSTTTDERKIIVVGEMNLVSVEHNCMITVKGYDENAVLISNRDIATDLKGPVKFQNIKLKDVMFSTNGDEVILGEGITRIGGKETVQVGGSGVSNGENFTINNWTNSQENVWTNWNSVYIGNNANYVANGDVNVAINGGTYNQLLIRNGTYNNNVNITLNGGYSLLQGNFSKIAVNSNDTPVFNGAVQIILNGGLGIDTYVLKNNHKVDDAEHISLYNYNISGGLWVVSGKEGGSLVATENAGEYKVSGGKIAYVKVGNKIYYGNTAIKLKLSAGEYSVSYIDTLAELKEKEVAVPEVGFEFVCWEDDGNGTLTAKFQTDTIDYRDYYIAPGGTGDGRSKDTPAGSVQAVLSSINADRMTSIDVATVYIDGIGQPDTWISDEQNNLFIQYNSTIDHKAKVIFTSLDFEKHPAKLAFLNDWNTSGNAGMMYVQGPTVFKDIWLIDQWANQYGSRAIIANGNDVTFENAIRFEANISEEETELRPGNTREGENAYIYTGSSGPGKMDAESNEIHGLQGGGVLTIDKASLARQMGIIFGTQIYSNYNSLTTMTENSTVVLNGPNLKYVYLTHNSGKANQIMTFDKNVNLIANGTAIDTFDTNLAVKLGDATEGFATPIVKGAVQIILNNGASIKNNYAHAYKDESATEKTPMYILSSAKDAGGTLDITENTGEFKVNSSKIAYVLTDGFIYYGSSASNLKIGKAGIYDVKYADSIEAIKQSIISSYGELSTWADDGNGIVNFSLKNPNYMLHIKNSGNANETFSVDISGIEAGKEYTVSYKYKRLSGRINYKGAYIALFGGKAASGSEITNYGKIYRDGLVDNNISDFTVVNNDGLNAEYKFKLSADEIDNSGNFKLGFYFSDKDYGKNVEFYISDLTVYESSDASKKNLLVNDGKKPDVKGWNTNSQTAVSGKSSFAMDKITAEYSLCDLTFFKKAEQNDKPEKMVQFQNASGWGGVEHSVPLEIGVTYRLEFSASRDTASKPSFNTDGNRYGICHLEKVESFDYGDYVHYIYEATVPETASNGTSINATSFVSLAIPSMLGGFFFNISLYETADPEKANMLTNADFKDGLNDWNYDWSAWFIPGRTGYGFTEWYNEDGSKFIKVVDFDEKALVTYKDDANFNDGEWWSKDDIFAKITDYAKIKGTIKTVDGKPMTNIKIVLESPDNSYSVVPDKNGAFDFGSIATGFYSFNIYNKDGEKLNDIDFYTLAKDDVLTLNIVFTPNMEESGNTQIETKTGVLTGAVYTPKLKTISNMKIYLRGVGETVTDENGAFEFKDVPVGEYEIYTVNDDGSEFVFRKVNISDSVKLTVKLKYDYRVSNDKTDTEDGSDKTQTENKDTNIVLIIIIIVGAVVVLGATVLAVILIVKRGRKKSLSQNK